MSIREELLFDFSMSMPRVLIGGKSAVIDNIKRIVLISETNIVVDHGAMHTSLSGENLVVCQLGEQRMQVEGTIRNVEFYRGDKK